MFDLFLWFLVVGPCNFFNDVKKYFYEGLLHWQTWDSWELEKAIKTEFKLLTYFETCGIHNPSKGSYYDAACEEILEEIAKLKALRKK